MIISCFHSEGSEQTPIELPLTAPLSAAAPTAPVVHYTSWPRAGIGVQQTQSTLCRSSGAHRESSRTSHLLKVHKTPGKGEETAYRQCLQQLGGAQLMDLCCSSPGRLWRVSGHRGWLSAEPVPGRERPRNGKNLGMEIPLWNLGFPVWFMGISWSSQHWARLISIKGLCSTEKQTRPDPPATSPRWPDEIILRLFPFNALGKKHNMWSFSFLLKTRFPKQTKNLAML